LYDGLRKGSLLDAFLVASSVLVAIHISSIISYLLGLVPMYPYESTLVFTDDIQLIGRHMLLVDLALAQLTSRHGLTWTDHQRATRLQMKLVGEVSAKAFVEVLGVVEDLADKDAVEADTMLAEGVDHRRVGIAALE